MIYVCIEQRLNIETDISTLRLCVSVAGNLCVKSLSVFGKHVTQLYKRMSLLLSQCLQRPELATLKLSEIKLVVSLLRSCNLLANERKSLMQLDENSSIVQNLIQYFLFQPAFTPAQRTLKQSESEMSDFENFGILPRQQLTLIKIHSIKYLTTIAKANIRSIHPHWLQIFPSSPFDTTSFTKILLPNENPELRISMLEFFLSVLNEAKLYLQLADARPTGNTSFTPLSMKVANITSHLHEYLYSLCKRETGVTQDLAFKCLHALVRNTNYEKISKVVPESILKGLILEILSNSHIKPDPNNQLLEGAMSIEDNSLKTTMLLFENEIKMQDTLLMTRFILFTVEKLEHVVPSGVCSILDLFTVLVKFRKDIAPVFKTVDAFCKKFILQRNANDHIMQSIFEFYAQVAISMIEKEDINWFKSECESTVTFIQNSKSESRASALDLLSTLSEINYTNLPDSTQRLVLSCSTSIALDELVQVKVSAYKLLGVMIGMESIKQDIVFIIDLARLVSIDSKHTDVNVRSAVSWALANLSDSLCECYDELSDSFITIIEPLLNAALTSIKDHEKCRSNGCRALGHLFRKCSSKFAERYLTLFKESLLTISQLCLSGAFKTRWNACHALSFVFQNNRYELLQFGWSIEVFESLLQTFKCKNFKVRINAVEALCIAVQRDDYVFVKDQMNNRLLTAIQALDADIGDSSETKFGEIKYVEQLQVELKSLREVLELT